jgi:DHA3 family tetracycline resistance protein-like MFS transporter
MHSTPPATRSTFGQMTATARGGVRLAMARPVVKVIIAISLVTGLAAEAWDRLYIPSAIDRFDFPTVFGAAGPVIWFGLSGVVGTLLGLAASGLFKRTQPEALGAGSPARLLAVCSAIQVAAVAAVAVFALTGTSRVSSSRNTLFSDHAALLSANGEWLGGGVVTEARAGPDAPGLVTFSRTAHADRYPRAQPGDTDRS